jgi:hypothetical protein
MTTLSELSIHPSKDDSCSTCRINPRLPRWKSTFCLLQTLFSIPHILRTHIQWIVRKKVEGLIECWFSKSCQWNRSSSSVGAVEICQSTGNFLQLQRFSELLPEVWRYYLQAIDPMNRWAASLHPNVRNIPTEQRFSNGTRIWPTLFSKSTGWESPIEGFWKCFNWFNMCKQYFLPRNKCCISIKQW